MKSNPTPSIVWLLGRALLPSAISGICCIFGAIILVGVGVLLASLHYGTILPNSFGGQLATLYTNVIVQPLETILQSADLGVIVSIIGWGLAGLVFYGLVEIVIRTYQEWRETRHEVQFTSGSSSIMIAHPLERSFIVHALWRFGVSVVTFLFTVAVLPLVERSFVKMNQLTVASDAGAVIRGLVFCLLVWIGVMHVCVVLLRLYTLRTRLFGDVALEARQ